MRSERSAHSRRATRIISQSSVADPRRRNFNDYNGLYAIERVGKHAHGRYGDIYIFAYLKALEARTLCTDSSHRIRLLRGSDRSGMKHPHRLAALHAALRFVITSETPSEHKSTLIEVLTQAIRDDEAAELHRQAIAQSQGVWQEHELVQLRSFLQGQTARSWQHADECVMQLATRLRRDPASVRHKATELGLGPAVDYGFVRQFKITRDE